MKHTEDDDMSMDEILASIRRYVTDDSEEPKEVSDNRVIRLTPDQEVDTHVLKRDFKPVSDIKKDTKPVLKSREVVEEPPLLSENSVRASAQAFSKLNEIKQRSGTSIEQFVSSLIKEWLDKNMPSIVEHTVQQEIERIRKAM